MTVKWQETQRWWDDRVTEPINSNVNKRPPSTDRKATVTDKQTMIVTIGKRRFLLWVSWFRFVSFRVGLFVSERALQSQHPLSQACEAMEEATPPSEGSVKNHNENVPGALLPLLDRAGWCAHTHQHTPRMHCPPLCVWRASWCSAPIGASSEKHVRVHAPAHTTHVHTTPAQSTCHASTPVCKRSKKWGWLLRAWENRWSPSTLTVALSLVKSWFSYLLLSSPLLPFPSLVCLSPSLPLSLHPLSLTSPLHLSPFLSQTFSPPLPTVYQLIEYATGPEQDWRFVASDKRVVITRKDLPTGPPVLKVWRDGHDAWQLLPTLILKLILTNREWHWQWQTATVTRTRKPDSANGTDTDWHDIETVLSLTEILTIVATATAVAVVHVFCDTDT